MYRFQLLTVENYCFEGNIKARKQKMWQESIRTLGEIDVVDSD